MKGTSDYYYDSRLCFSMFPPELQLQKKLISINLHAINPVETWPIFSKNNHVEWELWASCMVFYSASQWSCSMQSTFIMGYAQDATLHIVEYHQYWMRSLWLCLCILDVINECIFALRDMYMMVYGVQLVILTHNIISIFYRYICFVNIYFQNNVCLFHVILLHPIAQLLPSRKSTINLGLIAWSCSWPSKVLMWQQDLGKIKKSLMSSSNKYLCHIGPCYLCWLLSV